MRKSIVIASLLLSLFIAACSKSASLNNNGGNRARASLAGNSASTTASGSGRPATGATDDTASPPVEGESPVQPRAGFVNDYAGVIDAKTKEDLETSLAKFMDESKIEFAVVTVETVGGQPIAEYAMKVASSWEIGHPDKTQGGIIMLVAIKDRRWAIRWSPNLKDELENGTEDEVEQQMTAPFRQSNYSEGIARGVKAVLSKLADNR